MASLAYCYHIALMEVSRSLCLRHLYAPGCNNSLAVCISPLTSLEVDLTRRLQSKGISATYVGEQQKDWQETKRVLDGNVEIVFISPESIVHNKAFRNMLRTEAYKERMVALIVDEAHCVKTW